MNVVLFIPKRSSSCSVQNIPVDINKIAGYYFHVGGLVIIERKKKGRKTSSMLPPAWIIYDVAFFLSSCKCMCNPEPGISKTYCLLLKVNTYLLGLPQGYHMVGWNIWSIHLDTFTMTRVSIGSSNIYWKSSARKVIHLSSLLARIITWHSMQWTTSKVPYT